jgi:Trk K+ transport system NAD-binding subunit
VAAKRGEKIFENPGSGFIFETEDVLYILGKPEKIAQLTQNGQG